jgi:two-component system response regulator HydG
MPARNTGYFKALLRHEIGKSSAAEDGSEGPEQEETALTGKVMVVDDDRSMCELIEAGLKKRGYDVAWSTRGADALAKLDDDDFDVVLTDLKLGDMDGLEVCERVVTSRPEVPVVVITGFGSMDAAVGALRVGAYDFITKPIDIEPLAAAVGRAIQHRRLSEEVTRLREEVKDARGPDEMIGRSPAIRKVREMVARVGQSDAPVLITGESGTGKELVARALHNRSAYRDGPFVAINCAAVPANLLESELFGHVRGAFTDAKKSREGLFVQASGGTLLLDEIGEMPPEMQAKLLRALQDKKVRPVGSNQEVSFDVRLIAATNRDLEDELKTGRFREDLFYRINVVRIHVPPLRGRGNDVLLLAQQFMQMAAERMGKAVKRISRPAAEKLMDYDWPGNVRELENSMERAVTLARYEEIVVDDLPEKVRRHRSSRLVIDSEDPDELMTLEMLERRYIERVLRAVSGNKTQAAKVLGVDRRTLYRKLERYAQEDETH